VLTKFLYTIRINNCYNKIIAIMQIFLKILPKHVKNANFICRVKDV